MNNSILKIQQLKNNNKKIVSLTAYDYSTAKILESANVDIILVGDSLAMVALGHSNTLSVTMDEMLHHAKAVSKGAINTLIVADMPFMSYQINKKEALKNAGRFIKEANVHAVKLEGASKFIIKVIKRIIESGIPVMGHIGFTPQYLNVLGGYMIQAKTANKTEALLNQAKELEKAGVFAIVLEMVPAQSAKYVTKNINIPTIGIGAGPFCDGQILVCDDLLGKYPDFTPSFVRQYTNITNISELAVKQFCEDVRNNNFPNTIDESFIMDEEEYKKLNPINR